MNTTTNAKSSRAFHIVLWIGQILLAGMFIMVGLMKVTTPIDELSKTMPLAGEMPGLTRFIGISELLGGLGLILPAALRIKPYLTIWAAGSLAVVMVLALIFHLWRGEIAAIATNIILGFLGVFIAWGRAKKVPIAEKSVRNAVKYSSVNK